MSNYEPQEGDRVRFTTPAGTTIEGILHHGANPDRWYAQDGYCLYDATAPEQTELLDRPFKLNTAPGAVYGAPDKLARMVVRVAGGWLGHTGEEDSHWYEDEDITRLITQAGWVEFNLDGSRKSE